MMKDMEVEGNLIDRKWYFDREGACKSIFEEVV
jgi:hypothetical protein